MVCHQLKKSIACIPDFVNAAFGLPVEASSTCGRTPRQFCNAPAPEEQPKRKRNINFGAFPNRLPAALPAAAPSAGGQCQLCDSNQRHLQACFILCNLTPGSKPAQLLRNLLQHRYQSHFPWQQWR